MVGSAHAGEKVQQRPAVAVDQLPERVLAAGAHLRHEGEVVGFGLDGIRHETALLNQLRGKGKPFWNRPAGRNLDADILPNLRRTSGA